MLPLATASASTPSSPAAEQTPTVLEKIQQIPLEFWWKLGVAILAVVIVVVLLRKIGQMHKGLLAIIVAVGLSIVGFTWIYERNEPSWATPVVEVFAGFFPSKGKHPGR
ncbi:MAG: hypothetical protein NVV63_05130 [Opitutus sp.]|nr:hypothetical protein [Opitutus sp.]